MDELHEICAKFGVPIVEDAAQAIGSEDNGRRAGSMSEIGCFSFYPSKNLGAMGDAGMMTTNDESLANKLFALRNHGMPVRYFHQWVGINSRLDGFQGAVLRVKLKYLDDWTNKRMENASRYRELFTDVGLIEQIILPFERENVRHIYNQFVIRVPEKRDELRQFLTDNGIGTDIYYPVSLHLQECFEYLGYKQNDFPESEKASRETLAIPIFPEMTNEQQDYIVQKFVEFFS
jgi:dTDP-4-amino-4,6-dideoxygalactose transaminase